MKLLLDQGRFRCKESAPLLKKGAQRVGNDSELMRTAAEDLEGTHPIVNQH
jgi:hypothetical protein